MSRPLASSARAFTSTSKAVSVPRRAMRSCLAVVKTKEDGEAKIVGVFHRGKIEIMGGGNLSLNSVKERGSDGALRSQPLNYLKSL